jgi:Late embryogenesis abundant protein
MKAKSMFLGLLMMIFFLPSCISYQELRITNVTLKGVSTDNNKYRASFELEVDNPNAYAIKLSKPQLRLFVAGQEVQDWTCAQKVKIKRQTKSSYPFYVEISGKEVLQLLPRLFVNPSIKIDGSIRAGTMLVGKRIPVSIEEKVY